MIQGSQITAPQKMAGEESDRPEEWCVRVCISLYLCVLVCVFGDVY